MNITQGNIFWNNDMKIKYNYPYLTDDISCDVLIVGGGISGALTAYYQAKQGYKVAIIEKNLIGYNSTLESIGVLNSKLENAGCMKKSTSEIKRLKELMCQAQTDLRQIVQDMQDNGHNVEYAECNFLNFSPRATGRFALSKLYDAEINSGVKVNFVEQNEVLDIYSALEYVNCGIIFNPYLFCQELINMLSEMPNVDVYENTCAESINSKEHEVEVQTTNRFKIHASKVVLATGVDLVRYLKEDMLDVYKTYNVVAKLQGNGSVHPFVAKENGTEKLVGVTDGCVILNGEDVRSKIENTNDVKLSDGRYKKLYHYLQRLLTQDNFKIKSCFYGVFLQTQDLLPIIDELENMPNVYCNLGVGKNGILQNVVGAKMLKNICNDCYTKDMYLFRINR